MTTQFITYPGTGNIPAYANFAALPSVAYDGQAGVTQDTDSIYIYNLATTTWLQVAAPGAVLSLGNLDGGTAGAKGASIASGVLYMQSASASFAGLVNTGAQTFAGVKTLTSPIFITPALGTPASGVLTNCTGLPVSTGISGLGSGVATFLATPSSANLLAALTTSTGTGNAVFATSPTLITPLLGIPTSGTLTNCTGLPISTGVSGLGTGVATFLATPSSANLLAALTTSTGTGTNVFATSPTLVTPLLGTPTSGTLTNCTGLPIGSGVSGLGSGVATFLATPSSANLLAALTTSTGTGNAVFATSPTLVTPLLGTPTSGTLTNCTGLPISSGVSGLGTGVATFLATPSSANLAAALTDETGSGAAVFATSPTLVTPLLGTPTSGNLSNCTSYPNVTQSVAGLVASAGQLLGTNTNDSASSGRVGEYLESAVTSSTNLPANGVAADATTITITAGDWDVNALLGFEGNSSVFAGGFEIDVWVAGASGNSTTGQVRGSNFIINQPGVTTVPSQLGVTLPTVRVTSDGTNITIAGTTTSSSQVVRLKVSPSGLSAGTPQYRCILRARRVR